MAQKQVTVVINGQEFVSKAAKDAGDGLEQFGKKTSSVSALAAKAAGVYYAVAAAISKVGEIIGASLRAYDELNASQRKLEGTAKLLGVSQQYLNDIIAEGQRKFSLSRATATEYGIEVAKLAIKSGDASSATQLLASFLDLGAARGLNAAESLKAAQMSILGVDEGTDKFFGQNPSGLWADFAKVIGRSAGTFSEQDKAAALAFATLGAGIKVGGSYQAYLESAAGKQDVLNQRMLEAEASFGAALQPVRMLSMELGTSLMPILGPVARIIGGALAAAVVTVAKVFNILYGSIGLAVEGLGKLTNNEAMESWGKRAVEAANTLGAKLNEAGEAAGRAIRGVDDAVKASAAEQRVVEDKRAESVRAMAKLVEDAKKREGVSHKDATKAAQEAWEDYRRGVLATMKMLNDGIVSTEDVLKRLSPALQKAYDKTHIEAAKAATDALRTATDAHVRNTFTGLNPQISLWDQIQRKIGEAGKHVEDAARYTIDFAQSFGVLDRDAASALTSVVNIGSAVSKMATSGFSFAGVTGVLGGVANIVSTMMQGDAERRRLLKQNNEALDRLRKDIGGMNLRITGDTLVSAQTALGSVVDQLKGGRGAANEADVRNALYAQGLSMEDFDRIAKEFGIEVRTKSGALNVDSVKAVFEAIKTVQLGKVGGDFQSQLDFFTQGQDINNEQGAGRAANLLKFLTERGGVGALAGLDLSDPAKLREQLIGIRSQLNSAEGIDETQLGKLSGGQFNDLLMQIIGMLGTGGASGGGDVTVPDGTGAGGGSSTAPAETIQSVIKAMDANLAAILTAHTPIHERIAVATESSAASLQSIDGKMDKLIAVSAGTDRIDAALEDARYRLAVQFGQGAAY